MPIRIVVPAESIYDEKKGEFIDEDEKVLYLEHSLLSMSRWESVHKECFLSAKLSFDDFVDYIQCMSDEYIPIDVCKRVARSFKRQILDYMFDDQCAKKNSRRKAVVPNANQNSGSKKASFLPTEELYYVMFEYGIPIMCEKWHFSRLLSLMQIYKSHNGKGKKGKGKMSPSQIAHLSDINRSRLNGY